MARSGHAAAQEVDAPVAAGGASVGPLARPGAIGWRDRLIALLLFGLCTFAYYRAPVQQMFDWVYVTAVSHALLHEGTVELPRELLETSVWQLEEVDGRVYHWYPVAPAVLNVPIVWFYEQLGVEVYRDDGSFDFDAERHVLKGAAAVTAAAGVALLYLVARLFTTTTLALPLSLLFAFGTSLYSSVSRPYWSHAWAIVFLSLALLCLAAPTARRRWLRDAAGATALSWAFFCRPPLALSVIALTLFVYAMRRGRLKTLATVGAGWLALFVGYSLSVYEWVLPSYYGSSHTVHHRFSLWGLVGVPPEGVLGTLVSPSRGLFLYTPFLLVVLFAVAWCWRSFDHRQRWAAGVATAVIAVHWKLVASSVVWGGGASFGPRLLSDLLPWFLVLAAVSAEAVRCPPPGVRRWKWAWVAATLLLAVPSVWIHHRGAVERMTIRDWGVWNWRYPPFLFGLVWNPDDPLPGALVTWVADADRLPADGWNNEGRRWDYRLDLVEGIGYRRLAAAGGVPRGAFVFRGAGGGTTASLQELGGDPNVTQSSGTFELWFRPAVAGPPRQVLFETGGRSTGLTLFLDGGRPGVEVRDGGAATSVELVSTEAVSRGELSRLAVVLRKLDDGFELTLWINDRRVAGPLLAPGVRDWAGGNGSGLGTAANQPSLAAGEFHGEIALFRYYPTALDEQGLRHNLRADRQLRRLRGWHNPNR